MAIAPSTAALARRVAIFAWENGRLDMLDNAKVTRMGIHEILHTLAPDVKTAVSDALMGEVIRLLRRMERENEVAP